MNRECKSEMPKAALAHKPALLAKFLWDGVQCVCNQIVVRPGLLSNTLVWCVLNACFYQLVNTICYTKCSCICYTESPGKQGVLTVFLVLLVI